MRNLKTKIEGWGLRAEENRYPKLRKVKIFNKEFLTVHKKKDNTIFQHQHLSNERAFGQWKILPKNYKPIKVWLWIVYKINKNNCHLQHFGKLIQTQNRHSTSLGKINILTWRLFAILVQNCCFKLNSLRTYSLQTMSYLPLQL